MSETAVAVMQGKQVAEFSVRDVKARAKAMHDLMKDVMQKDVHYGTIPGTQKPTLYKPGAEKICLLFQLVPSFKHQFEQDGEHLTVRSECTLTHMPSGTFVSQGWASCSSKESKYAFRRATRSCPKCGKEAIIKGKAEYGGGWVCFAKKGGCGEKWKDGDQEIESMAEGQEENPNLADTHNTILKMSDKRAYVAATLFATAASDIYTQDVEDFADEKHPAPLTAAASTGMITPAQHGRIAILVKEKGVSVDELKQVLQQQFSVATRKELTEENADKIVKWLENLEVLPA